MKTLEETLEQASLAFNDELDKKKEAKKVYLQQIAELEKQHNKEPLSQICEFLGITPTRLEEITAFFLYKGFEYHITPDTVQRSIKCNDETFWISTVIMGKTGVQSYISSNGAGVAFVFHWESQLKARAELFEELERLLPDEDSEDDEEYDDNPDFEDFVNVLDANEGLADKVKDLSQQLFELQMLINQKNAYNAKARKRMRDMMKLLTSTGSSHTHAERNEQMLKALDISLEVTEHLDSASHDEPAKQDTIPF